MDWLKGNPYYSPESAGLVLLGTVEKEPEYDFDIVCLWQHEESGKVYFAADSGCSCPTPFEDYRFNGPDDHNLTELTRGTWREFEAALDNVYLASPEDIRTLRRVAQERVPR